VCARSSRDYGDEEPLTFGLFGDRKTSNNASNISSNKFRKGLVSRFICLRNYVDRRPPSASHVGNRHLSAEIGYSQLGQRPSACHEADVNASGPAEPMRSPRTGALIGRLPILVFASRRRSRHLKGMNRSSERAITGNWLQHIPRVATYAEAR